MDFGRPFQIHGLWTLWTENDLFEPEIQLNSPKNDDVRSFVEQKHPLNEQTTYPIHTTNVATRFLSYEKFF